MDFNDFMAMINDEGDDRGPQFAAIFAHLAAGVAGDHITITQLIEALNALINPDTSPLGLDIRPFFSVGAHLLGVPSLTDFFHSMYLVGIPGAYAVMCSQCTGEHCDHPPARRYRDMTSDDELMINQIFAAIFASVIPDTEEVKMNAEGLLVIRTVDPSDKPDLMDKMVANFRKEIDDELPTVVPPHERNDEPGGADWMKRWT